MSAASVRQGQTLTVSVSGSDAPAEVEFNGRKFRLFPESAGPEDMQCAAEGASAQAARMRTLIAVPADLRPGTYELTCGAMRTRVNVVSGQFPVQRLRLPPGRAELKPSPGEAESVQAAKETLSAERLWKDRFQAPVKSRISAGFGLRRIVNGKLLTDYFHSGLDYAAGIGTPVRAPAPGRVVLARPGFRLHGNTVAIDHGQGVVTFYIHLQKIGVKEGETVKAGQVVGAVGQSGRANGPHLHFSLYVNQTAANPLDWFARTF